MRSIPSTGNSHPPHPLPVFPHPVRVSRKPLHAHRALRHQRIFPQTHHPVTGDVAERMDPIFYSDAQVAVNKALSIG